MSWYIKRGRKLQVTMSYVQDSRSVLGMLIRLFGKTGFRLFETGLKPVFGFTDLHKNILLYKANNFMYYA